MRQQDHHGRWLRRGAAAITATAALVLGLIAGAPAVAEPAAPAAPVVKTITGANWVPGDIISDALFYDSKALTAAEIQTFLNSKVGRCTNGRCLNVIQISPAAQPVKIGSTTGNVICNAVSGGTMSVATYIFKVQVACGISAKVILATLQKEQGLITKTAPSDYALSYAMGWACPDDGGCQAGAAGLAVQLYKGSRQLVTYKKDRFSKQPGVQPIRYSPNASCGSSSVNVRNYATAALYSYTPYQPNAAALANLSGTGNSCSSYGNRNFWYYYSTWFGSTHGAAFGWVDSGPGILAVDSTGALQLWGGNGANSWKTPSVLGDPDWAGYTHVQGIGDFNGDGHRDIMGVDAAGALWISPSDGLQTLSPRVKVGDGWGAYTQIIGPGDFSGDGHVDLITTNAAGVLELHRGDGLGGIAAPVQIGTGWDIINMLIAVGGDFSGDGKTDFMGRDTAGRLWLYRGTGSGTVSPRIQIGAGWNIYDSIFGVLDFTGDRKADIMGRNSSGQLRVYPGTGKGGLGTNMLVGTGFTPSAFPAIGNIGPMPGAPVVVRTGAGDLKYDGYRDLLARNATTGALTVYPGAAGVKFGTRLAPSGDYSGMTAIAGVDDFDRNGFPDVLMRDASGTVWLYPVNKAGAFGGRVQLATGWGAFTAVLGPGDLNGDRFPDVIVRDATGALILFAGDGHGGLAAPVTVGSGWNPLTIVTPGDLDGDGSGDLIALAADGTMKFYPGTGAGGWGVGIVVNSGWQIYDLVFSPGDWDEDGNPDLIARDPSGGLWFYRGTGAGTWMPRVQINSGWQIFDWID